MKISLLLACNKHKSRPHLFNAGDSVLYITYNRRKELTAKRCTIISYTGDKLKALVAFNNDGSDQEPKKLRVFSSRLYPMNVLEDPSMFEASLAQKAMRCIRNFARTPIHIGAYVEFYTPLPPENFPNQKEKLKFKRRFGLVVDSVKINRRWSFAIEDINSADRFDEVPLNKIVRVIAQPRIKIEARKED